MSFRPIILAEDHDKLRRVYADMLGAAGFKVMRAADGEKAVDLLHKVVNPQLIILDVMMPRMNGIEACVRMRKMQDRKACPIIFLTSLDDPEDLLKCLRAGGDDFIMKSSPLAEILARILQWARRGVTENAGERRHRAIEALEQITAGSRGGSRTATLSEVAAGAD